MAGSLLLGQYNDTLGSPPASSVFGGAQVFGPGQTSLAQGSNAGVPAPANAQGQSPDTGGSGAKAAIAAGASAASRPAYQQPVFWLIVLLVISVWMLGHVAHVTVK